MIGFAAYFSVPRSAMVYAAIAGAVGWTLYNYVYYTHHSLYLGMLLAAFSIGVLGEIFSRIKKYPATVFIIVGIIPLVPGMNLYYTMLYLVESNTAKALSEGISAIVTAGSISIGILLASVFSASILRVRKGIYFTRK